VAYQENADEKDGKDRAAKEKPERGITANHLG
jgi:hypothetical protein